MAARRKNAAQANAPHSAPHTARPYPGAPPPQPTARQWPSGHAGRRPGATAAQIATDARSSRAIASRELAVASVSRCRSAGAVPGFHADVRRRL